MKAPVTALCAPETRPNRGRMRASRSATATRPTKRRATTHGCVGSKYLRNSDVRKTPMRNSLIVATVVMAIAITSGLVLPNEVKTEAAPKAEDDFELVKVADGVYAAIAKSGGLASGNAGFVVGDGGVLIFDTFFTPAAIEELIGVIQTQTQQPIKYAVNSHYHLDHTGGNQVLNARGVPIIAHDNVMQWQTTKNRRFLPTPDELQK